MPRPTLRLNDGFEHTSPGLRDEVRELQEVLNGHGADLGTDGLFGRDTESAVLRLQSEHQLLPDGIVGAQTWAVLLGEEPPEPAGTGDTIRRSKPRQWRPGDLPPDGGGYGRGLMQIDYDAHPFARGEEWKDPQKNIHYGCDVLKQNLALLKRTMDLEGAALLRAAVAGYNCGAGNVMKALQNGRDVDFYTHGRDYSRNTLDRAGWFQLHDWD